MGSFFEFIKIKNRKPFFYGLNIVLFCTIFFELLFITGTILKTNKNFSNILALATTVNSENFTELYFENHLNLPTEIIPNHPYSFKFTIHNLENKNMTYIYKVYLQSGTSRFPIDQGQTITVSNGKYATIEENFQVNAPISRSLIVINLINKHQQIDFWVTSPTK